MNFVNLRHIVQGASQYPIGIRHCTPNTTSDCVLQLLTNDPRFESIIMIVRILSSQLGLVDSFYTYCGFPIRQLASQGNWLVIYKVVILCHYCRMSDDRKHWGYLLTKVHGHFVL